MERRAPGRADKEVTRVRSRRAGRELSPRLEKTCPATVSSKLHGSGVLMFRRVAILFGVMALGLLLNG